MLTINHETDGETTTFSLAGRFDFADAPQLEAELKPVYRRTKTLIFDLEGLESISSSGLRVLLSAQKQMNRRGRMRLINVGEAVLQTMEIKGFTEIFNISGWEDDE